MAWVIWSPRALDDIEAISRSIGATVSAPAALFIQSIFSAAEGLAVFPNSGRVVPETAREDIRELIVGNYRIIYLVEEPQVSILTVHHGSRQLRGSF